MAWTSRVRGLVRSFVAWSVLLSPTLAWGAEATLVQQIGELSGEVAEAVAAEVNVVPFSPAIDARTTPIIVAPGEAFVHAGSSGTGRWPEWGGAQSHPTGLRRRTDHPAAPCQRARHRSVARTGQRGRDAPIDHRPRGSRLRSSSGERHPHGQDRPQYPAEPASARGHRGRDSEDESGRCSGPSTSSSAN